MERKTAISLSCLGLLMLYVAVAGPAVAQTGPEPGAALPEPDSLVLLGIGVIGLIAGRRAARKPADD